MLEGNKLVLIQLMMYMVRMNDGYGFSINFLD